MREGYCKHGKYVGGCGADLMCAWCEGGTEPPTIPVYILRCTHDGPWELFEKPVMCYDYAHVDRLAGDIEELSGDGRLYALAVG
jgi:hypothetical protein